MRHRIVLVAIVAVASAAGPAHAEPDEYSPETALGVSVLTMCAGPFVFAVGAEIKNVPLELLGYATLVVGPGVGHLYAAQHVTAASILRVVGGVAIPLAIAAAFSVTSDEPDVSPGEHPQDKYWAIAAGGLAMVVVGTVYDFATTRDAVRRANERRRIQIVPTASPSLTGVSLSVAF